MVSGDQTLELKDYWRTIKRRWVSVVVMLLLCVSAAAFVTWQTTPQYSSTARLFVATNQGGGDSVYQGNLFASERVTSYADLVPKSPSIATEVARLLDDGSEPDELREQITATVVPETVNLELTATDPDPSRARDIAQAYAQALSDLVPTLEPASATGEQIIVARVVDNAQVSTTPVAPQPTRNLGLGIVLGLLLGVALAVVRELMDTTVSSAEDVAEATPAPILGRINADPAAAKLSPVAALSGPTRWAEAFRVLRTNMQYVEVDHDKKVFVVTSSLPGEGKTTTSVNLAVTMAMGAHSVVLVECDLRRPMVAKRLEIDGAIGTTSVLVGRVKLEDALQTYGDTGLHVLACGPIPPNPSELLQSRAMAELLADLREQFDIVVIDAPPLLPVTDAALLAAMSDGAIVVTRHGRTTRDQLAHAIERLDAVDAKTLGVVLNLTRGKDGGDAYAYSYSYSYAPQRTASDESGRRGRDGRRRGRRKPR
ncbi:polysaccharide biosynthesis tyrosine autokinase [Nocardioides dilutus]